MPLFLRNFFKTIGAFDQPAGNAFGTRAPLFLYGTLQNIISQSLIKNA